MMEDVGFHSAASCYVCVFLADKRGHKSALEKATQLQVTREKAWKAKLNGTADG